MFLQNIVSVTPVLHSYIVRANIVTNIDRHTHTNTHGENIIPSLSRVITRMWNMISSPATPTVCLDQKSSNLQSRNVTLSMSSPSQKIIVFEMICNVAYYSGAKFTFPIEQPSNKATKCGIMRSWKLKAKPNHGCCNKIAITISYISDFVSSW